MGDGQPTVGYGNFLLLGCPYPAGHLLAVDHGAATVTDAFVLRDTPVQDGPSMHVKGLVLGKKTFTLYERKGLRWVLLVPLKASPRGPPSQARCRDARMLTL